MGGLTGQPLQRWIAAPAKVALVAVGFGLHSTGFERVMRTLLTALAVRLACLPLALRLRRTPPPVAITVTSAAICTIPPLFVLLALVQL